MPSFIERFKHPKVEEKAAEDPEKEEGPTLEEIQQDSEQSALFGMYLGRKEKDGLELANRLLKGGLTDQDVEVLREKRKGFLETKEQMEEFEANFSPEVMSEIVESSPDLKKLSELRSPEKMRESVLSNLSEVAIKDPERFGRMRQAFAKKAEHQKTMERESAEMVKLAKQYGIAEEEYAGLLEDMNKNPLAIDDALDKKVGWVLSLFIDSEKLMKDAGALDKRDAIKKNLNIAARINNDLGGALREVLMKNSEVRKTFLGELSGEKKEKVPNTSFNEAVKIKNESKNKLEEEGSLMRKKWQAYHSIHEKDKDFSLENGRQNFAKSYAKEKIRAGGFWRLITQILLAEGVVKTLKQNQK